MLRNIILLFIVLLGTQTTGLAQNTSVSGRVLGDKKTPLAYITATLLKQADSSIVNGGITDENGRFKIDDPGYGSYLLRISGLGIETKTIGNINVSADNATPNLGKIELTTTSQVMEEVKVVGSTPMMEMSIDKKVFNVDKNITAIGGSASDALQNVPSVSVDVDGAVSLRGKNNVTILIDGKPATLLGGDEATALQSLPASSVDQIEVITNPSAKYDATGMTGIINIITKREKKFGFNGNVRLGAGTRDKYNGNLSMNIKNEKWNLFLNSSYRQNRRYSRNTVTRNDINSSGSSFSYEDQLHIFTGFFNSLGAEYRIDSNNSITLTQNLNKMEWGGKGRSDFSTYGNGETLLFTQQRDFRRGGGPFSSSTSLDYKHKFKKPEEEITANATFVRSWMDAWQEYTTMIYDDADQLVGGPVFQDAPGKRKNTSQNSQVDYVTPLFTKEGKLEAGLKSQLFWLESTNDPTIDSAGLPEKAVDSVLLNGYDYTQQIYAAYTSWGDKVDKFGYKLGLRMEYAYYEGTAVSVAGQVYNNEFLNLFPSAFASYELPKGQSVYLSYTRRTHRPRFWELLPYVNLSNPQDTSVGNPDLTPEFIHNLELSYNKMHDKGHNFIVSTYYQYTQNLIERYRILYGDGTSFTQRRNLNAGVTYGLELTGQVQLVDKVWDATINTNFFQNEIIGANIDPALDNSGFGWFGKLNTTLKLPADFSFQVNINYDGPKVVAQGYREEVYWLDLALRKNFWDGKANLVLNVSDIFNTRKYITDYDFGRYTQNNYSDRETRIGNITFSYRFGSSENKGFGGRRRGGKSKRSVQPDTNKDRDNIKDNDDDGGGGF